MSLLTLKEIIYPRKENVKVIFRLLTFGKETNTHTLKNLHPKTTDGATLMCPDFVVGF